ncbi:hypothetical protein [Mycobacterium parascrofulaceum]|uniref:hypothetical protein n=1 Tax=Mycobacterium parascrofulaceum TaxID=240125 RepID=UPI0012F50A8C
MAFNIQDLLGRRHNFVYRCRACIRGITVATQLNGLYLSYLLWQRLLGSENLIYLAITRMRYFCQSAPQIVGRVSS